MKGFVLAGTGTGVGKTTITAAFLAALRARGLVVQPFKCGPDYIDAAHHAALAGRPSYNLDTWMAPAATNEAIFCNAIKGAGIAVVEGVMGLFDGVRGDSDEGSTAEIAKLLGLPVVLVLDASTAARSVAATVKGFRDFDPQLRLIGVILNGPAGPGHVELLRKAIAQVAMPVLGWFPRLPELSLHERHLGLVTAGEKTWCSEQARLLASAAEKHIALDLLLGASELGEQAWSKSPKPAAPASIEPIDRVHIGIARDRAFSFYYESSLDALRNAGAELVEVSPLSDIEMPPSLDGLYLGGGYPEIYADELSRNTAFLTSVREFAANGRPIYAECGGLMYLAETLVTLDRRSHRMAAALPLAVEMLDHLDAFGYTEVQLLSDCLVGQRGTRLRGHSFHYSRAILTGELDLKYCTQRAVAGDQQLEGYSRGNVLASYIHLSFAASPEAAATFVQRCVAAKAVAA